MDTPSILQLSGHISTERLLQYLEGDILVKDELPLADHLKTCKECQRELKVAYELLKTFTSRSAKSRPECPSESELEGYRMGKLSAKDRKRIEEHLKICGFCIEFERLEEVANSKKTRK